MSWYWRNSSISLLHGGFSSCTTYDQRFSLTHMGDNLSSNSLCPHRSQDQTSLGPAAPLVSDVIRTTEVGLLFWIQNLKQFLYFGIHLFLYICWFHMFNFSGYSPSFSIVFLCILHRELCFSSILFKFFFLFFQSLLFLSVITHHNSPWHSTYFSRLLINTWIFFPDYFKIFGDRKA